MKLVSWNVNGLRAVLKKGFLDILQETAPDVLCLQETKCQQTDVAHVEWPDGYEAHFSAAVKKGYSGTGVITRVAPISITEGIGIEEHDQEGRTQTVEFEDCFLVNVYVPNAQNELRRLEYRQRWDAEFCTYLTELENSKRGLITTLGGRIGRVPAAAILAGVSITSWRRSNCCLVCNAPG